jgi:ATP-dependent DNA helicase
MDVATLYEQCDDGDAGSEWAAAVKEEMELGFETLAAEPSTIQKKPADLSSSAIANLDCLLDKASIFSKFLHERIHESLLHAPAEPPSQAKKRPDAHDPTPKKKRAVAASSDSKAPEPCATSLPTAFRDISRLRDYQVAGIKWLVSLYENGLNGILADEMGLGKTVQTIGLLAHLWGNGIQGPFLVVGPLSVIANWVREVEMWTDGIPVVLYHGSKQHRDELRRKHLRNPSQGPIFVTSFEVILRDRKFFKSVTWRYLIVDEGHRLKNKDTKLIRELKQLSTENRLLLTGTPLQNNLGELWSLLNFLLPQLFDDLRQFESWFDFHAAATGDDENARELIAREQRSRVVSKLHEILDPFLLRRIKADVLIHLPPKVEIVVQCQLTKKQDTLYDAAASNTLAAFLKGQDSGEPDPDSWRKHCGSLNNTMMQLRKVTNHPYLLNPNLNGSGLPIIDEQLVSCCGKMQMLDRCLRLLHGKGHKVLIFCQFTRMIDILEDFCELRDYSCHRIDGSVSGGDRQARMDDFNGNKDAFIFLLSTRAGGLGINLATADTVIIYDSDWNPQVDLQAQDRCHRMGQTKPVSVIRFITANTIETMILKKALSKRTLEQIVIKKGRFKGHVSSPSDGDLISTHELRDILMRRVRAAQRCPRACIRSHPCEQVALKLPEGNVSDADLSEILLKRKLKATSGVGWHVAEVLPSCCLRES